MRKQFRNTVMDLAARDPRIVLLFGDISVFLFEPFREAFPEQFFNVGICENTLISMAAGLGSQGMRPVVHTLGPFLTERCFEQIKLDLAYNRFPCNIVTIGASFDYAWDGPTHHAYGDLAFLRLLPGIEVVQPGSTKEFDLLFRSQYGNEKTTYFRLSDNPHDYDLPVEFGKAVVLKDSGSKVTVMTAGPILANVAPACEGLDVNLVYFHTIKPIDVEAIARFRGTCILVVHDAFGLHEAICTVPGLSVTYLGLPDRFLTEYGRVENIRKSIGLDPDSIRGVVEEHLRERDRR
jgi:transketolase